MFFCLFLPRISKERLVKGYLGTFQKRVGQLPKAGTDPGCDILDDQHDDDDKVEEEKQKRVGEREKGIF